MTLVCAGLRVHFGATVEEAIAAEAAWHLGEQTVLVNALELHRGNPTSPWYLQAHGLRPVTYSASRWQPLEGEAAIMCWPAIGPLALGAFNTVTTPGVRALLRLGAPFRIDRGTEWQIRSMVSLNVLLPDEDGMSR